MFAANLRCEYRPNPLGLDERQPRLSWEVAAPERGQRQTAYRVLVASGEDLLVADRGDRWDSGRVAYGDTTAVVYEGQPLSSHDQCFWKVAVWDAHGACAGWSAPAFWGMGLLDPAEWVGEWIGYDGAHDRGSGPNTFRPLPYLRTTFQAAAAVRRAVVYATALGLYDLFLNGARVTEDYFNPGWTDYAKRVYYRAYDVTALVRPGENRWCAVLADGWFCGYLGWEGKRDHYGTLPRLRAQLHLELEDGTRAVIATGSDWRAVDSPILQADFLMGESYSSAGAQDLLDFQPPPGQAWQPVAVGAELNPVIQAHPGPPVRTIAEFRPVNVTQPAARTTVFDLGQNVAGVARLTLQGYRGAGITLRFAERLNADGTLHRANLRGAAATDGFCCDSVATETWQPRFTYHGFQYVEALGLALPQGRPPVVGVALGSDTPRAGAFECSDPLLNKLASNVYWTQRANFLEVPTDCPQRDERLGWTGDAQMFVRAAALNADVQAFFAKWLIDLHDAQRADGQFPAVAPLKVARDDGGPGWSDAGVIIPWALYEIYGDKRLLERCFPAMRRFVEFCLARTTPDLLPAGPYRSYGDWLSIDADTSKDVICTAYLAHSLHLLGRAAGALGRTTDELHYLRLFSRAQAAFNRAYVQPDGRVLGDTQTGYVLALAFQLVSGERWHQAAAHLVADIERRGGRLSTGFLGTKDLMLVLARIGRNDVAYRLIQSDAFPSWGFSIKHGATSIWERWDGWTPEKGFHEPRMNSFSHYAFGAVYQWMVETIGGITSETPGYAQIRIAPQPGGTLTWARVGYHSIRGPIVSHWRKEAGRFTLEVTLPANTTGTVVLPGPGPTAIREGGRPLDEAPGVVRFRKEDGGVAVNVGSGQYRFEGPER